MIFIENRTYRKIPLARLRQAVQGILRSLGRRRAGVNVILVGDRRMRSLNRRYLGHDRPTDVIAFSQLEGPRPKTAKGEAPFLGDVIISLDTTARQAKAYGNAFLYELCFYICHGILHLIGYDDDTPRARGRMWRKQEKILKRIWLSKKPKRSS